MSDLGGGYMGVYDLLLTSLYLKSHSENNFKKEKNTANLEFKRRAVAWGLNTFAFMYRKTSVQACLIANYIWSYTPGFP